MQECECARACAACGMVSPLLQPTGLAHSPMKARVQVDSRLNLLIYYLNHLVLVVNSTPWSDTAFQHLKQTCAFNLLYSYGTTVVHVVVRGSIAGIWCVAVFAKAGLRLPLLPGCQLGPALGN